MNKIIPDPADYMQDILENIKYNLTNSTISRARELTNKIIGFEVYTFGDIKISEEKLNYFRNKIDPILLKNAEDKIVKSIEENLDKAITKTLINQLTKDVIDKVYNAVADRIFTVVHDRIAEQVEAKINESLNTWLVAAKFIKD